MVDYVIIKEFGCAITLTNKNKTIMCVPLLSTTGLPELDVETGDINWGEVTAPEEAFLDLVNEHLGTDFSINNFAGR